MPKATIKEAEDRLKIALIGRPNVGKSSLFNTLAKKQQAVVADFAGTTRDVNRTTIKYFEREIELLDTAGVRRNGKIEVGIEKFSVLRTIKVIEEAEICLLILDVNDLSVHLDQKLAGMIEEAGKGLVFVVTKWDAAQGKTAWTHDELAKSILERYPHTNFAPLIFTSTVTGQNVTKILDLALEIDSNRKIKLKTSQLNDWLSEVVMKHPPSGLKNKHPKLKYMTQITEEPCPSFKFFGTNLSFLHWSYKRHLENELRRNFNLMGTPVRFYFLDDANYRGSK